MRKFPAWYVWLCYLAVPLSGLGVEIYTPSLPSIMHFFHTNATTSQLSVSIYIITFGISQLLAGPITERIGRKSLLLMTLIAFAILSGLIVFSTNVTEVIVGRALQGVCAAGVAVPVRAILADICDPPTYKRKVNYMIFAWGLGPILGPWIGSHLQANFGWTACFLFLIAYTIILVVLTLCMKETQPPPPKSKQVPMLKHYQEILRTRSFIPSTIFLGFLYALVVLYGIVAPFIIEIKLHLSVLVFGRTALLLGLVWALGAIFNRFTATIPIKNKVITALILMCLILIFMLVESHFTQNQLWVLVVPTLLMGFLASCTFTALVSETLSRFQHIAASINGILFAFLWFFSGLLSFIGSHLTQHSINGLSITFLGMVILSTVVYLAFIAPFWDKKPEET